MNWNLVIGPGCLLLGILITLYVKDSARIVAKEEFREQIAAALSVFKLDLINALDHKYRLQIECRLMMEGLRDRAAMRMDAQERQAHRDSVRLDAQDKHMEFIDDERNIAQDGGGKLTKE